MSKKLEITATELTKATAVVDEKFIRHFLDQALQADDQLAQQFMQQVNANKLLKSGQTKYSRQLAELLAEYLDGENEYYYDDYWDAPDPGDEIQDFLKKAVAELTALGAYSVAFELLKQLVETTEESGLDDESDLIDSLTDVADTLFTNLLAIAPVTEKQAMLPWFIEQVKQYPGEYFSAELQRALQDKFIEPVFLETKLAAAKELIHQAPDLGDWACDSLLNFWPPFQVELMGKLAVALPEIENFAHGYWENAVVRYQYIEVLIARKAYDRAVAVAQESLGLETDYSIVKGYRKQLKRIYQITDQPAKYRQQLQAILTDGHSVDFEILHELKAAYQPQEWQQIREKLFQKLSDHAGIDQFYAEEQRYDLLLDYVLQANGLTAVQYYLEVLKAKYPGELLQKYQTVLRKMATPVSNRTVYAEIAEGLGQMAIISGGTASAQTLRDELLTDYPRRRAMREELNQVELK